MAFTRESFGERLFASVGQSYRDLPATLEALACALVSHGRLRSLTMQIDEIGVLSVERDARGLASHWDGSSTLSAATPDRTNTTSEMPPHGFVHEIPYAQRRLGAMQAELVASFDPAGPPPELLAQFARQCGRLVMHDRLEKWSLGRLGQPLRLIGLSASMRELDRFVEAASASPLPVLLQGEYGTEKLAAAAAIHCCGPLAEKPFVAVDCSDPEGEPEDWLGRATGGTLYLSAIDAMSPALQQALRRHLPSRFAFWPHAGMHRAPRVIASTTSDLAQLVAEQRFSCELASELSVLVTQVAPLRERRCDIPALARDTIARLGFSADRKVSDALTDACLAYHWPENHAELERLVGRLATMSEGDSISASDIQRHAPALAGEMLSHPPRANAEWTPPTATPLDRWALRALDLEDRFADLDPALGKALRHLGSCFEELIGLADVAAIAATTPLRMSALFRTTVGVSFKKLLRQIRILAACKRLAQEPAVAITQLAFEVGFGDLSYFERSFRSVVGFSPRQFRQGRLGDRAAVLSVSSDLAEFRPQMRGVASSRTDLRDQTGLASQSIVFASE